MSATALTNLHPWFREYKLVLPSMPLRRVRKAFAPSAPQPGVEALRGAGVLDELRQRTVPRGVDLPAVLAQVGRDPRQSNGCVDRLLRVARNALLASEHAILVDLQIPLLGHAPDDDVVCLGAR